MRRRQCLTLGGVLALFMILGIRMLIVNRDEPLPEGSLHIVYTDGSEIFCSTSELDNGYSSGRVEVAPDPTGFQHSYAASCNVAFTKVNIKSIWLEAELELPLSLIKKMADALGIPMKGSRMIMISCDETFTPLGLRGCREE